MLYSEIRGWQWLITWDNPTPANSTTLKSALRGLGSVIEATTKTTVIFAPRHGVSWKVIRDALTSNLNQTTGKVVYVNMMSKRAFEWGPQTNFQWQRVI